MEISLKRNELFDQLYPDVVEHGRLRLLLKHLMPQMNVQLQTGDDKSDWLATTLDGKYGKSQIYMAAEKRLFLFDFWQKGVVLAEGRTDSVERVLLALHELLEKGVSPLELTACFDYVTPHENAAAFYQGPQFQVALQWETLDRRLIDESGRMGALHSLLQMARQHPRLSQLFPYTSMWSLCFSSCTGYPFQNPCPSIQPLSDEDSPQLFTVGDWNMDGKNVLFQGDAHEVIEFVAAQLPSECGPARQGTAEDE
ncbi:MAG TPA: DUF6193 family natural product biosynthesis protein [Abditibacterium sp.]|jgi:hypothetical protein